MIFAKNHKFQILNQNLRTLHPHFPTYFQKPCFQLSSILMLLLSLCIVGPSSIDIGTVDISLQTLFILIIALLLKPFPAFGLVAVYLLLGSLGLPVFSDHNFGIDYLFGPTAGFLFSFPFFAMLVSQIGKDLKWNAGIYFLLILSSYLILLLVGFSFLILFHKQGISDLSENFSQLLVSLLIKCAFVSLLYLFIRQRFRIANDRFK